MNKCGKSEEMLGCLLYIFGAIFYFSCMIFILFHEWDCKEGFVQTLLKKLMMMYCFFPSKFGINEAHFVIKSRVDKCFFVSVRERTPYFTPNALQRR